MRTPSRGIFYNQRRRSHFSCIFVYHIIYPSRKASPPLDMHWSYWHFIVPPIMDVSCHYRSDSSARHVRLKPRQKHLTPARMLVHLNNQQLSLLKMHASATGQIAKNFAESWKRTNIRLAASLWGQDFLTRATFRTFGAMHALICLFRMKRRNK